MIIRENSKNMALHFSATRNNHISKGFDEDIVCKNL